LRPRLSRQGSLAFNQREYATQVGVTAMSDFRPWYRADFEPRMMEERGGTFCFVLEAIKPSRVAA
jgi:hypothetical protein